MKNLILISFLLATSLFFSQSITFEPRKLDSLIFLKINKYRSTLGVKPFVAFEDSLMRKYSQRLTRINSTKQFITHSDSVGYVCNGECIYRYASSGKLNEFLLANDEVDYDKLAEKAVTGWINSPTHQNIISGERFNIATVTSVIKLDKEAGSIQFDSSFHALDKGLTTSTGYSYKTKNRAK